MLFLHLWGCPRPLAAPGPGPGPRCQGRQQGTWGAARGAGARCWLSITNNFCHLVGSFALQMHHLLFFFPLSVTMALMLLSGYLRSLLQSK